jgi:hypothetical protein
MDVFQTKALREPMGKYSSRGKHPESSKVGESPHRDPKKVTTS